MERKRFMSEVYAKSWPTRREKFYGFLEYDKHLCDYVCQHVPKGSRLLEVAIGTSYPIADFLQKAGYVVHGIDISPNLIDECRKLNPNITCKVADAEDLEYEDNYFDATYCFHSTWYFPHLNSAIDEMIRVTRPEGMVIFDIQNRNNRKIEEGYHQNLSQGMGMRRVIKFAKNIASAILHRSAVNWHFLFHYVVHEVPTYPEHIYQHLSEMGVATFQVMVKEEDESIHAVNGLGSFEEFGRLIFVLRK